MGIHIIHIPVAVVKESCHDTSKAGRDLSMELVIAVIAVAILLVTIMMIKRCPTKPEEPVMEVGRAKGMMALGKRDYEASDVITVAQQETLKA